MGADGEGKKERGEGDMDQRTEVSAGQRSEATHTRTLFPVGSPLQPAPEMCHSHAVPCWDHSKGTSCPHNAITPLRGPLERRGGLRGRQGLGEGEEVMEGLARMRARERAHVLPYKKYRVDARR